MKTFIKKIFEITLLFVFVLFASGCVASIDNTILGQSEKTPLQEAQDYVTSIDSHAAEISKKADEYIEAIGKSDYVAAKLKFEEIIQVLDECASMDVPSTLEKEGNSYKNACANLKEALNTLNDISASASNASDLTKKLSEAQSKYELATKSLSEADKSLQDKITELKNAK